MQTILEITYLYLLVLTLAVFIERIMEVLMSVYQYLEWKFHLEQYWTARARRIAGFLSANVKRQWLSRILKKRTLTEQYRSVLLEHKAGHSNEVLILSGDLVRQVAIASIARIVATGIGVGLCVATKIDLIALFNRDLGYDFLAHLPLWFRYLASGAIVGLGAEPVHKMIVAVEKRRKAREKRAQKEKLATGSGA